MSRNPAQDPCTDLVSMALERLRWRDHLNPEVGGQCRKYNKTLDKKMKIKSQGSGELLVLPAGDKSRGLDTP